MVDRFELNPGVTVATQLRTLRALYAHVRKATGHGARPVVEIDLDLTAAIPSYRTRKALIEAGRSTGIDLFTEPDSLRMLPGYSDEAWVEFVYLLELPVRYPKVQWLIDGKPNRSPGEPFAIFHEAYWTTDWLKEDLPTPGLGAFVERIGEYGAEAVFVSGRWLSEQVQPTLNTLERGGIRDPKLVIGNDRHASLVPPELAVSDSEVKVAHQKTIARLYGTAVTIIDDRVTNREAIIKAVGPDVLGIAACIPGFTFDPASGKEPLRLSTFESFDQIVGDLPVRVYMNRRYAGVGLGQPWNGLYEGLGLNRHSYALPRLVSPSGELSGSQPFAELLDEFSPGSLTEHEFIIRCSSTMARGTLEVIEQTIVEAKALARRGLASPFPESDDELRSLRLSLIASWLHSRDIETVMQGLGYPLHATGIHDIEELVPVEDIRRILSRNFQSGSSYSTWVTQWAATLGDGQSVNVGAANPSLAVGLWRWKPNGHYEDAMDIHRASSHHDGDGDERYDPVEAAVNNVLHQREGRFGIRKESIQGWFDMYCAVVNESEAEDLAKSSVGSQIVRDTITVAARLESSGFLTPWGLVKGASFQCQPLTDR